MILRVTLIIAYLTLQLRPALSYYFQGNEIRDFEGTTLSTLQAEVTAWKVDGSPAPSSLVQDCSTYLMIGGINKLGYNQILSRDYTGLPDHNIVYFSVKVYSIHTVDGGDGFAVQIGTHNFQITRSGVSPLWSSGSCNGYGAGPLFIAGSAPHTGSSLTLYVKSLLDQTQGDEAMGVGEVSLTFANVLSPAYAKCPTSVGSTTASTCYDSGGNVISTGGPCDTSCKICKGNGNNNCLQCKTGYFYSSNACSACNSSCQVCHGPTINECTACITGYTPFFGTCIPQNQCLAPLANSTSTNNCTSPCQQGKSVYPDGTCANSCAFPYPNQTTTTLLCINPCTNGQILYYNSTCKPSTCSYPFIQRGTSPGLYCDTPCNSTTDFIYWNSSCKPTCPGPLHSRPLDDVIQLCDPPRCGLNQCKSCNITNTSVDCDEFYYCELSVSSFCLPYNIRLQVRILKAITNGYLYEAIVTPTDEIIESIDEEIMLSVDYLTVDSDFKYNFTKISKGHFYISLEALKPIDLNPLQVHIMYSPRRMMLKEKIETPKIVFLSESLLAAANDVGSSSNNIFYIFVILSLVLGLLGRISDILSFVCMNQYLYYLLYLNVEYLVHTKTYFRALQVYNIIFPDTGGYLDPAVLVERRRSLPKRFFEEDFPTNFLQNAGPIIALILLMLLILGLATLGVRTYFEGNKLLGKVRDFLKWNETIRQIYAFSLPFVASCILELHRSIFGKTANWTFTMIDLVTLFAFGLFLVKSLSLIQNIPRERMFRVLYSDLYGALWYGLTVRTYARLYFWLVTIRGLLLAYMVVLVELFPWAQQTLLIVFQFGILSLFIGRKGVKQVLRNPLLNRTNFVNEVFLFLLHLAILGSSVVYAMELSDEWKIYMGWTIIGAGLLTQVVQCFYSFMVVFGYWKLFYNLLKKGVKRLRGVKQRRKIKRPEPLPLQTQSTMRNDTTDRSVTDRDIKHSEIDFSASTFREPRFR